MMNQWIPRFGVLPVALSVIGPQGPASTGAQPVDPPPFQEVYVSPGGPHKIVVRNGDEAGLTLMRGISTLEEFQYLGRRVYLVSDSVFNQLSPQQIRQLPLRDDQNQIRLVSGSFDTTVPQPGVRPGMEQIPSAGHQLFLIQFVATVQDEWFTDLSERAGLEIVHYMPENGYLVWADSAARASLVSDVGFQAHLQWVGPHHPAYKIDPSFDLAIDGTVHATIQLYWHPDVEASVEIIRGKATDVRQGSLRVDPFLFLTVDVPSSELEAIARLDDVTYLEPAVALGLSGERQGQIVAGNLDGAGTGLAGPGYLDWLENLGFTSNFDFVVDITDDGFDRGETDAASVHPVFLDANGNSRVAYVRRVYDGATISDQDDEDFTGHGTMSASIVGGLGTMDLSDPDFAYHGDGEGFRFGLGIAPFVRLGATKIFDFSLGAPYLSPDLYTAYDLAYSDGARISNNSWAVTECDPGVTGGYGAVAWHYDRLTRDVRPTRAASGGVPGNQEMLFVFAAGNLGVCTPTQLGQGGSTAKNTLTVGAGENYNATGDTDGSGQGDQAADNVDHVLKMSGRGPTDDNRFKPDIIAPGSHIFGAASQHGTFNGSGVSGVPGSFYYPPDPIPGDDPEQTLYTWSSGTSQATPAISGASALLRQWFIDRGHPAPSPAMTKAYLMNSATFMAGIQLTGPGLVDNLPSNHQGMGRVNLGMAFDDTPRLLFDQIKTVHETATVDESDVFEVEGEVANPGQPFRVTMVYTDAGGDFEAEVVLKNDLDLTVEVGGNLYLGNDFNQNISNVGSVSDTPDGINNVESVFLPAGTTGDFTVTVTPADINSDGLTNQPELTRQDFALVIYNAEFPARKPTDIILVLDASGSMNGSAPGGTTDKIQLLKDAAEMFVRSWEAFSIPQDRMGVVFFSNAIAATIPAGPTLLQPFQPNANQIIEDIQGQGAGGYTALGGGILTAMRGFDGPENRQRHIIVFSNGMQNRSPMVTSTSTGALQILDDPFASHGDSGILGEPDRNLADYGVKAIHTIGTGVSGASWATLLTSIADQTGGKHHFTNAPDEDLEDFFLEDLVAALRVDPVEKVATKTGALRNVGSVVAEQFEINATVRQATFAVSWRGERRDSAVDFRLIAPGGTPVPSSLISETNGDFYRIATVKFPLDRAGATIPHAGTWQVVFEPDLRVPEVTYRAHLIVDDADLRYYFDAPTSGTAVGDPIPLSLSVQQGNRTLTGLEDVRAAISRPRAGVGTWLSRNEVGPAQLNATIDLDGDQFANLAAKKAFILMQDPVRREELASVTEIVQLFDDGVPEHGDVKADDGVYSAMYPNTLRPGSYDVDFSFQFTQDEGGLALRSDRKTLGVSMKRFDSAKSGLTTRWAGVRDGGYLYEVGVTPIDPHDNFLGPGFSVEAVVVLPDDKWSGRRTVLTDNLDGSYSGSVWLNPEEVETGASIRVDVGDRAIGRAPLPPPRGVYSSFYSGLAIPVGDFDNTHDQGPLFEVGIGYELRRSVALEALFGRYSFDPSYEIYGGGAYIKGFVHMGSGRLFGAVGIGAFKPENADLAFGVSPGLGLDLPVTPRLRAEVAGHYFHLFNDGNAIDFFGVKAGMKLLIL